MEVIYVKNRKSLLHKLNENENSLQCLCVWVSVPESLLCIIFFLLISLVLCTQLAFTQLTKKDISQYNHVYEIRKAYISYGMWKHVVCICDFGNTMVSLWVPFMLNLILAALIFSTCTTSTKCKVYWDYLKQKWINQENWKWERLSLLEIFSRFH